MVQKTQVDATCQQQQQWQQQQQQQHQKVKIQSQDTQNKEEKHGENMVSAIISPGHWTHIVRLTYFIIQVRRAASIFFTIECMS